MNAQVRPFGATVSWGVAVTAVLVAVVVGRSTANGAQLNFGLGLDYANSSSWNISGVPGDSSYPSEQARIASGTHDTRSAIYDSATGFTTTSRLLVGHGGSSNGTLTMTGSAGTLTFGGDAVGVANYVGVDGGTGTLNVEAGTLATTAGAYFRVGANGVNSTGTVNIESAGQVSVAARLHIANGDSTNLGTVNVNGGTLSVSGATILADKYSGNAQGGLAWLNVQSGSTVSLGDLDMSNGGGKTNLGIEIIDGLFNPIGVDHLNLNDAGQSGLDVSFSGTPPAIGDSWSIIHYATFANTERFDVGTAFSDSQGHHLAVDYGDGANDDMTLKLVSTPKSLLFDVGPLGVVSPGDPLTETTHNGLVWNNVSEILGSGAFGGVEHADGTAAPGVTVTAEASGRGGSSTMNAAWDDAQGVPSEVMGTWYYNNQLSITIGGLNPGLPHDVELFNAFNLSGTNLSDMQVNGLFADGTTASTPENGDGWSRYNNGWVPRMGLFFDDVYPNALGQFVITFTGGNPTVQAIRITQGVPEPASAILLALGIVVLIVGDSRRKSRAGRP